MFPPSSIFIFYRIFLRYFCTSVSELVSEANSSMNIKYFIIVGYIFRQNVSKLRVNVPPRAQVLQSDVSRCLGPPSWLQLRRRSEALKLCE